MIYIIHEKFAYDEEFWQFSPSVIRLAIKQTYIGNQMLCKILDVEVDIRVEQKEIVCAFAVEPYCDLTTEYRREIAESLERADILLEDNKGKIHHFSNFMYYMVP